MLQSLISNKIFLKKILITGFLPVDYIFIVRNDLDDDACDKPTFSSELPSHFFD